MGRVVALSGWGQPYDALSVIAPGAAHIDYARHRSVEAALEEISGQAQDCEVIIGWSLGGEMAARAVASGQVKPKFLVLLATPYQFVGGEGGMGLLTFQKFRDNYARNPARTLNKAWELVIKGDSHGNEIRAILAAQDQQKVLEIDWLHWLDMMHEFTSDTLDFTRFPPTLLIHGREDVVVSVRQSQRFAGMIPQSQLRIFEGCGHAPHWHDPEQVKRLIKAFAHV